MDSIPAFHLCVPKQALTSSNPMDSIPSFCQRFTRDPKDPLVSPLIATRNVYIALSAALTERGKKALWRRAPPPPARGRSRRVCRRIHESTTGRPPCHPRPASFARGRRRRPPGPARATGVGPARQQAAPSRAHPGLCSGHRGLSSGAEEEPGAADLSSDTEGQPGADGASSCSRRKVLHSLCKKQCTSNRSS